MPIKSGKEYRFMAMIAHGGKSNKKNKKGKSIGPSPEVAEEMVHKTSPSARSKFMKEKR